MARETGQVAESIAGDGLYQERARRALPILVRQAESGRPVVYSDLAEELGMSNARNLNYPLGSIGTTLANLSKAWKEKVPPLQCLAVNKKSGLPGEGIAWFLNDWGDFKALPQRQKKEIVAAEHSLIFAYPHWAEVLTSLSLQPIKPDFSNVIREASEPTPLRSGGESDRHRALKEFVAQNPTLIGLPKKTKPGKNEVPIASGDCLDVSFRSGDQWVAAEVKTTISDISDVTRGLFQCVKYRAVMEAVQVAEGCARNARAILVLEGELARDLVPLRNILGIEVCEGISPAVA
jgi:hypothetical protein